MKKSVILLLICITALSIRCISQTATIVEGCAPLEVEFSAPLSSENKYYWDFKKGDSSEKQNPVNVFGKPGTYNVTFQQGTTGPVLKTITIKVYPRPVPKVSFDPIGCTPYDATLKNTSVIDPSIQINKFKWVFAEGPGSNNSEIVHNFNLLGKHTFAFGLETEFPSCNIDTSYRDAIEVVSPPSAFISTNPGSTISCEEPFNVTFSPVASGTKTLTYTWDMGNSKTSDLKNPPQQSYPKGQYNVLLTISYKEVPSCKVTAARTVSVGKPKASIIATRDSICPATYFPFKTDSPGRIEWKIGSLVSNKAADSVVLFDKGYNSIRLIVRSFDGRCADTAFSRVFVDDIEANIEPLIGFTCESPAKYTFTAKVNQDNVKYHWTFSGDTATSDKKTVEHTYVSKTDSLYYGRNGYERIAANLRVISQITGCESIVSTSDTMWLPNARILPNLTKGCAPLTIKMEDSCRSVDKIVEYKWLYGDNNTEVSDKQKTVTHTYTKPGEYDARIVVKTARGCIDTSYAVRIEVGEDMSSLVDFKASKNEVCPGEQVKLEVTKTSDKIDGYHFYAEDQRLFHCQDEKSATWSFNHSTGMQDVLLTVDYNGCFTTIPKYDLINVKGAIAKIDFQAQCSDPLNYTFTSKSLNADKVTWTLPDMTSNAEVEKYTFKNQGKFNIRLTAETAGCPASTATALINAVRPVAKIKIDTLLCFGQEYKFSAYKSENVFSNCHTGYT
jgi:PKD repeat protein